MNRAFLIIFVPAVLVAIGYLVVFRFFLGGSPQYWRLVVPLAAFGGAFLWLARKYWRKPGVDGQP